MILPFSKSSSNEALSILSKEGGCFSRFDATEMVELLLAKKEYCVNFLQFCLHG